MIPRLQIIFFRTELGVEPVRNWLKTLSGSQTRAIGKNISIVQFEWPLGMPLVRKFEQDLWEVRTTLVDGIARVFFTVDRDNMVLLHGFIKKSQKTPQRELETARSRLRRYREAR